MATSLTNSFARKSVMQVPDRFHLLKNAGEARQPRRGASALRVLPDEPRGGAVAAAARPAIALRITEALGQCLREAEQRLAGFALKALPRCA